ncbi:hypothetical protein Ancab_002468 [Ancistrocladus abbreviatus]
MECSELVVFNKIPPELFSKNRVSAAVNCREDKGTVFMGHLCVAELPLEVALFTSIRKSPGGLEAGSKTLSSLPCRVVEACAVPAMGIRLRLLTSINGLFPLRTLTVADCWRAER